MIPPVEVRQDRPCETCAFHAISEPDKENSYMEEIYFECRLFQDNIFESGPYWDYDQDKVIFRKPCPFHYTVSEIYDMIESYHDPIVPPVTERMIRPCYDRLHPCIHAYDDGPDDIRWCKLFQYPTEQGHCIQHLTNEELAIWIDKSGGKGNDILRIIRDPSHKNIRDLIKEKLEELHKISYPLSESSQNIISTKIELLDWFLNNDWSER